MHILLQFLIACSFVLNFTWMFGLILRLFFLVEIFEVKTTIVYGHTATCT